MPNRHGVMASDSVRICVIVPRTVAEELQKRVTDESPTISAVVRNCIAKELGNVK